MNPRIFISAIVLSNLSLTAWSQTCGLRDNGATMTDPVTGIEIQKCQPGGTWKRDYCDGPDPRITFDEAVARFGKGEWRLITRDEAVKVTKQSKGCPELTGYSWTSSTVQNEPLPSAWYVDFRLGEVKPYMRGITTKVRLVRSGQSSPPAQNPAAQPQAQANQAINQGNGNNQTIDCVKEIYRIREEGTKLLEAARMAGKSQAELHAINAQYMGYPQKKLFEGVCASHPNAQTFVNSANTMIAQAGLKSGNATSSASAAGVNGSAAAGNTSNPDYSDRQKIIATSGEPAHQCLSLLVGKEAGIYGGFRNSCGYKVEYTYCAYRSKDGAWSGGAGLDCESEKNTTPQTGSQAVGPHRDTADLTKGAERIFWFACKAPAIPYQVYFDRTELRGMCKLP